jgi:cytochrome P450
MHVQEFFSAGTESSSTTVEWALAELVVHPELMRRAQEEIDGVVGLGRLVHDADIPHLPFLQAIVKESFRLHPAAPLGVPRESTQPVEAFGYRVPAETRLIYNIYAVHRDPAVYENPDEFDPDRFLHRHLLVNHLSAFDSYELVPFGVGRRMCPGYTLGNFIHSTVVHFMLANLIHSYDWSVPGGGPLDMTASMFSVAMCLKNPLTLLPKLRHGAPPF